METYAPSRHANIQRLVKEAITMRTDPVEPKPDPDLPPPEGDETPSDDE